MAKAFSPKQYFQKIFSPDLLTEFYKNHEIVAIFDVTEHTPRKDAVSRFVEFHQSLSPEEKLATEEELARILRVSSKHSIFLLSGILKKHSLTEVTTIECTSDHDVVLYHYLFNKAVFEDLEFFHQFFTQKRYMLYEAEKVTLTNAEFTLTELAREYTRIAQKENEGAVCTITGKILGDILYVDGTITEQSTDEGMESKVLETIRVAYLPEDMEVLIFYTGKKYEKLLYLDTFLRTVCKGGYQGKEQSFSLSPIQGDRFDFANNKQGVPLMTWKIKGITLSFGSEKIRKKMKFSLPSSMHEYGLSPLTTTLEEIGLVTKWKEYTIESVTLVLSFVHMQKGDKSVQTPCTVSLTRSSLCSLFPYDRYARTLLKASGIEKGFVEPVQKEKEDVAKKWEV